MARGRGLRPRRPPRAEGDARGPTAYGLSRGHRLAPAPAPGPFAPRAGDVLEIAWDGHRVMACRAGDEARLWSPDFREWTDAFPALGVALQRLAADPFVIDGFVCVLEGARPSFDKLRAHVADADADKSREVVLAVWDLLHEGGEDLRARPLSERRARLKKVLEGAPHSLIFSEELAPPTNAPAALLAPLARAGIRGVVARASSSMYPPAADAPWVATPSDGSAPLEWERSLSAPPKVTNASKVLYPKDGITKADIAAYYDDVAPVMLAYLRDRPAVCQRWPDGIRDFTWYQHRVPPRAPDYLRAVWIEGNRRIVIESREALLWMVNQAALTFHGWASRVASLANPDWAVIDLDPGPSTPWEKTIAIALAVRNLLELLELPSVPKTSGKKGLHVLVPLAPGQTPAQAHELAYRVSLMVSRLFPEDIVLEAGEEKRGGRLYLDHLQNFVGKSLVLPYSLRDADGAPASTPLAWSEVTPKLDPSALGLRTLRKRLDAVGDLARPLQGGGVRIEMALAKLRGAP